MRGSPRFSLIFIVELVHDLRLALLIELALIAVILVTFDLGFAGRCRNATSRCVLLGGGFERAEVRV
jgi:hypothetical protein